MSATRSRIPAFARWSALPIGLVVSAALVWQASYAAFTGTTTNGSNTWDTGTVSLTDDDSTTLLFEPTNLKPGDTASKCIVVTYGGSLNASVKLYTTALSASATNELDDWINIQVQQGTGGTFADCTGFAQEGGNTYTGTLEQFVAAYTNFSTGFGSWTPAGSSSATRVYRFTYTVNASAPDTVQNSSTSLGFTWEAQNT